MDKMPGLSVVIITRNEEKHIARAIESVLATVENWPAVEIVLVDSASTDNTVSIASSYPISIIRLRPEWFLSASAGRYIGMKNTCGDLLMYLDGDMELIKGWLEQAVPILLNDQKLAGIAGYRRDIYIQDGRTINERDEGCVSSQHPVEVQHFGGAALYRRSALEQVGGFNPHIISDEEPELCMRLRYAGYKLICIPLLMCKNYTLPIRSWHYFIHRLQTNLWLGHGQVPRYHLRTGMLRMVIRERGSFVAIIYLAGLMISLVVILLALLCGNFLFLGIWLSAVVVFLLAYWVRKGSLEEMLRSIVHQSCVVYGTVRGFMIRPRPFEDYPTDVEVIQTYFRRASLHVVAE
ncbi:MAG: glycosyltransferase [Anaerolineales bacterium]|nr:glycosyltransferase [Anaerolineales bacterium]